MRVYYSDPNGSVDAELLKIWGDWMRRLKQRRKHLQRIYERSQYVREQQSIKIVDAEIRVLRDCINQVHISRLVRQPRMKTHERV